MNYELAWIVVNNPNLASTLSARAREKAWLLLRGMEFPVGPRPE